MKTMYEAIANSPETMLKATLNATDTTVSVVDVSVLPQAPNLVCVGSGDTTETIRYGAIDSENNLLLNCERGFQGVASKHLVNTRVSRNFTAYDNNTFKENIEALKVDVDGLTDDVNNIENKLTQFANPNNILINSNFKVSELINQRGLSTYTGIKNTFDTWWGSASQGASIDLTGEYVKMVNAEGAAWNILVNKTEEINKYMGKKVTMSALVRSSVDGAIARIGVQGTGGVKAFYPKKNEWTLIQTTFIYNVEHYPEILSNGTIVGANELEIAYVKLEFGEVATPFVDDDRAIKLTKCQRYLQVLSIETTGNSYMATRITSTFIGFDIRLIVPMRIAPTIVFKENMPQIFLYGSNIWASGFNLVIRETKTTVIKIDANKTSHGITMNETPNLALNIATGEKVQILVSAEL